MVPFADERAAIAWHARWWAWCSEPVIPPDMFTIKQVSDACGLPGPVIMQWVPRTWVEGVGWLFSAEQLQEAVATAEGWRRSRESPSDPPSH